MSKFTVRPTGLPELDRVQYLIRGAFASLETQVTAITASVVNAVGVTKLVAGTNITIDPAGGQGVVTVSAAGGGNISGSLVAGRVTLSAGLHTITDDANLTYNTGTGILRSPLVETNTVGGFGGGGVLSLENNHATPATYINLTTTAINALTNHFTISTGGAFDWLAGAGVNTGDLLTLGITGTFGSGAAVQVNTQDTYIALGGSVKTGLYVTSSYPQYSSIVADMGYFGPSLVGYNAQAFADLIVVAGGAHILSLGYGGDAGPGAATAHTDAIVIDGTSTGTVTLLKPTTASGVDLAVATGRLVLSVGTALAVSSAGTGAFRYDNGTNKLQFSNNGGAWTDIGTGTGGGITGTLAAGQVVYATGASTVTSEAGFEYDDVSNILTVPFVITTTVSSAGALNITAIGSATIQPAVNLLINPTGVTKFQGFANGFLKTSAGDGTVIVDTSTYGNITGSLTAGRVTLSTGAATIGDDANLTYNTGTGILQSPLVNTNNVSGFGGGAALALYNNVADAAHLFLGPGALAEVKGDLFPSATGTYKNGTSAKIWTQIYATTHYAGTLTGFGGGGTLTIQNNDASPVTSINLDATLVTVAGGSLKATGSIGILSNTISGFGGGNILTLQNHDSSPATLLSLQASNIQSTGDFVPATDLTYNLGATTKMWATLFVQTIGYLGANVTMDFASDVLNLNTATTGVYTITHGSTNGRIMSDATGIAFFTTTAGVAQQTGGAATAGGSYTATEQGMINRMYTALQNYGLLT